MNGGHVVGPGGGAFIPGDVCAKLAAILRRAVRMVAATDGTTLSGLGEAISMLEDAAAVHKQALRWTLLELQAQGSADGGTLLDTGSSAVEDLALTAEQASEVLGVSAEYVRRMARKRRIVGRCEKGSWQLDAGSVLAFRSEREKR